MDGPIVKRLKLLTPPPPPNWSEWTQQLNILEQNLVSGCCCSVDGIELHRPVPSDQSQESTNYSLQFLSLCSLLCDLGSSQRGIGFICPSLNRICESISNDKRNWEVCIEYLLCNSKFLNHGSVKCLVSLIIWKRIPSLSTILEELLEIGTKTPHDHYNELMCVIDIFRGLILHCDEDEHPLQMLGSGLHGNDRSNCCKIELDEPDFDLKEFSVGVIERYWSSILLRIKPILLESYCEEGEGLVISFLNIWDNLVNVKSNLNIVNTKLFYTELVNFIPVLQNSRIPSYVIKKLINVYNEILCYGTTLSLQESLPEDTCHLAHTIIRHVKSRSLLQRIQYSKKGYYHFGGNTSIDSEVWESRNNQVEGNSVHVNQQPQPSTSSKYAQDSSKVLTLPIPEIPQIHHNSLGQDSSTSTVECMKTDDETIQVSVQESVSSSGDNDEKISKIYIGPSVSFVPKSSDEELPSGDLPLLRSVVLLILKCLAITVRETKEDDSSSSDEEEPIGGVGGSSNSPSSDYSEMKIIERTVLDVLSELDNWVKDRIETLTLLRSTPLCQWIVEVLNEQDDILVEGILCTLDIFNSFINRINITQNLYLTLNPVITLVQFLNSIAWDKNICIDLLIGNETSFLLYLLRILKYIYKNVNQFILSIEEDKDKIIQLFLDLKSSLVSSQHFPYNIDPIIRLIENIHKLYIVQQQQNSNNGNS